MLNEQDSKFLSIAIYENSDVQITSNKLTIKSLSIKNGPFDPAPPLLNFRIYNSKQGSLVTPGSISFKYDSLYGYLNSFQKSIYSGLHNHIKKIHDNNDHFESFECSTHKSKLKTTLLHKMEFGGMAVSLSIIPKEIASSTGATMFMALKDYIAMVQLLKQYQNSNYLNYCFKFTEMHNQLESDSVIGDIKNNLHQICGRIIAIQNHIENPLVTYNQPKSKILSSVDEEVTLDLDIVKSEPIESSSSSDCEPLLHSDLADFLNANVDKMDIGLSEANGDVFVHPAPEVVKLTNNSNSCLLDMIGCDASKFEQLLTNISLEVNPIRSFIDMLNESSSTKLIYNNDGFSTLEIISSLELKRGLNNHLQNKIKIPSVSPILIDINEEIENNKIDLAIELLVFFSFYSYVVIQLKEKDFNTTNNKELISFIFKEISCPLIFSYIPKGMTKKIVRSLVKESFVKMTNLHVFDKIINDINTIYTVSLKVTPVIIENKAEEIFGKITANRAVLTMKKSLERLNKNKIVHYPVWSESIISYDTEQIKKIILLNINYLKSGGIDIKNLKNDHMLDSFSDLPPKVIKAFNLEDKKHSNANLKRYISSEYKDDSKLNEYLNICDHINCSYYDLKGIYIEFTSVPIGVLKAILLWDIDAEPMIEKQYTYYKKLIQDSTIEGSMVLSMLKNIGIKMKSDFINSLTAATKELGV